jgi:hypothetical protein
LALGSRTELRAQALFLASSQPAAAAALRARLGQWPQALALAERHDPRAVAQLCCQHGQAREFRTQHQHQAAGFAWEPCALFTSHALVGKHAGS